MKLRLLPTVMLALLPMADCAPELLQALEQLEAHATSEQGKQRQLRLRLQASLVALREGAPVDKRDEQGYTALMLAALAGEADCFRMLHGRGASTALQAPGGVTFTMLAAQGGNENIFHTVLAGRSIPARAADAAGVTLFQHACMGGNMRICNAILHAGGNAYVPDSYGRTSLMYAAIGGNTTIFYELLHRGGNPRHVARDGMTLLHAAARGGSCSIVQTALNIGFSPNDADSAGKTPLMEAAQRGPTENVALMLAWGADPSLRDHKGVTAAMYAAASGQAQSYDMLGGSPPHARDAQGRTSLLYAIRGGNARLVRRMLDDGADPTVQNGAPLRLAKACGRTDVTLEVAARIPGIERETINNLPIHSLEGAIYFTQFLATHCTFESDRMRAATLAAQLVEARSKGNALSQPDDSKQGNTPLQNAVLGQFHGLANFLLAAGADVNARSRAGSTALMTAVQAHSPDMVRQLLEAGADVNAMTPHGITALKLAAAAPWVEVFELLLEHGADPELNCPGGTSTLDYARAAGPEGRPIVKRLTGTLCMPSDINAAITALRDAMRADDRESFEALLTAWPDANATADADGRTLLMHALLDRVPEHFLTTLLQRGADPNATDKAGRMPLHYVSTPRQRRLLIEHGAIPCQDTQAVHFCTAARRARTPAAKVSKIASVPSQSTQASVTLTPYFSGRSVHFWLPE